MPDDLIERDTMEELEATVLATAAAARRYRRIEDDLEMVAPQEPAPWTITGRVAAGTATEDTLTLNRPQAFAFDEEEDDFQAARTQKILRILWEPIPADKWDHYICEALVGQVSCGQLAEWKAESERAAWDLGVTAFLCPMHWMNRGSL